VGALVNKALRARRGLDFRGRVVVITGGSRGLGLVLARLWAVEGARLALLARDPAELERAEADLRTLDAEVMTLPCDVRDQGQVEEALSRVVRRYGQLDVLVNNAGIIQVGPLEHMALQDFEDAMAVHFWGPLYASLAAVNYMRPHGGRIVNIASIGGEVAVPHMAPYSASKFALVGLSDALRNELAKDKILVTTVTPGLMRTGSHVNALFKGRHREEYTWFSLGDALPISSIEVTKAASQIIDAARHGDPALTITLQARLLSLGYRLLPGLLGQALKLVNRWLPEAEPRWGHVARSGWDSQSSLSPSNWTRLADEAALENNELAGHLPQQLAP
jgi:NAD(P)-dependent dehydrogenase (short-subunit alcohol dehydrogenase family)